MWSILLWATFLFVGSTSAARDGCTWTPGVPNSVLSGSHKRYFERGSVERCKKYCEKSRGFFCRSFEYSTKRSACFLQDVDSFDKRIITREKYHGYTHYEHVCENDPRSREGCPFIGPISNRFIKGNNLFIIRNVSSPEECMARCKSEPNFHCRSFDYQKPGRQCNLAIVDREKHVLTSSSALDYYERTCKRKSLIAPCKYDIKNIKLFQRMGAVLVGGKIQLSTWESAVGGLTI
ncbi:hypothetical protein CAPTEDRAFT_192802 [Capitella teleta]|uniref:Apple domain-containing protein n=1 Tax=Capitella teleta TaxID=283909 RepID=R7TFT8_CAPTE|nr:hypothetical protein CAPTEDRAFT_192802 [Capitella teleta]|eukprot:ELT92658.1 hypothetical protein CAPTEDRAFT_192802 [Capitella teleta]